MKKFIDFWRDGIWQSISVIIAIIGLAWVFYDKPVHDLQVVVLSNTALVNITDGFTEEVKITYAGRETENISIVEVKLENTGNQPLPAQSIEEPIKFIFLNNVEILKATQISSVPENLTLQITISKNEAIIEPALLNPQDRVTIRFVVTGIPSDFKDTPFMIDARILNVKSISLINILEQPQSRSSITVLIDLLASLGLVSFPLLVFLIVFLLRRGLLVIKK